MSSSIFNQENGPETGAPAEQELSAKVSLDESLRQLRLRRMQQQDTPPWLTGEAAIEAIDLTPSKERTEDEAVEAAPDDSIDQAAEAEFQAYDFAAAFEGLGQEIKRVGREMFKTNRATERNQELFTEALTEIRQLAATVAQLPAQNAETLQETKFEAKAALCRELLRLADTLTASLAAADELLPQLQSKAEQPAHGLAFRFAATRELQTSLAESVNALRQWHTGQRLLAERVQAILQNAGVRAIEAVGRPFDPAQHRAVSTAARHDVAPNTIVGEELKGYMLEGRILRYAEVIVAKHE